MTSSTHARKPRQPKQRFWTARRLAITFISLALLATLAVSSCTQPDTSSTTNTSVTASGAPPANTAAPGKGQPASGNSTSAPASNAAPPSGPGPLRSIPLAASLLDTPLTTIDGKSLKFSDYKGKVVVVNLWASWCGPCRIETPELIKMSKEFKAQGVEFVGLTTKGNDPDVEPIKEFVREQQVPYKTVWDDGRFAGPLTQAVRARAVIPQSFVLLRDGSIYKHFEGFSQAETPRKLRQAIEEAVNSNS